MQRLHFSWVVDGEIGGHAAPVTPDDLDFLRAQGIRALVRLVTPEEYPKVTSREAECLGLTDFYQPVRDFGPAEWHHIPRIVDFIRSCVSAGKPVAVSCLFSYGRTGTIIASYLVSNGLSAVEAIREVREKRPSSIEFPDQELAVADFERVWKARYGIECLTPHPQAQSALTSPPMSTAERHPHHTGTGLPWA